jgi:uncharacterized membrane protein
MWGATRGVEAPRATDDVGSAATRMMPEPPQPAPSPTPASHEPPRARASEAPTQRMDEKFSQSYPSIFVPPTYNQPPAPYQQPPQYQQSTATQPPPYQQPYAPPLAGTSPTVATPERTIAGLNVKEKWATMLPYAPFYIGIVVGLIELLMVPRREVRVRFHAAQGLALHLVILVIGWLFSALGFVTRGGSSFGSFLFWLASFVFLIISMIRVWKGEEHHIGPLSDATKWLNERIDPRKK